MKKDLWLAHIESCLAYEIPVLLDDRSNISDFFCADVVGNERFAQNYGGYPRSDIAEINEQTNMAVANRLLQNLNVIPVSDLNSGLSDAEILLGVRSKYCQTPSEQTLWLEDQLKLRDIKRAQAAQNPPKDGTIDFKDNSNVE